MLKTFLVEAVEDLCGRTALSCGRPGDDLDRDDLVDEEDEGRAVHVDSSRFVVKAFKTLGTSEQLLEGDRGIVAGSVVTDTCTGNDTDETWYRQIMLADAIGTPQWMTDG